MFWLIYFNKWNLVRNMRQFMDLMTVKYQQISEHLNYCFGSGNFVPGCNDYMEYEFDDFVGFGNRIEKFNGQLKIYRENCTESFYFFGLYGTLFSLLRKRKKRWIWLFGRRREIEKRPWMWFSWGTCSETRFFYLGLNLSTFEQQCRLLNNLSLKRSLFLRVYELKKKFRYLIKNTSQKKM